jgi:hypothetical protein
MHVVTNKVRRGEREYSSHLLRRSYREGGKVRKETLANLSHLPDEVIELIRGALQGRRYLEGDQAFAIERSLPAGHVQAALAMARRLELARLLDRAPLTRARPLPGDDRPAGAAAGLKAPDRQVACGVDARLRARRPRRLGGRPLRRAGLVGGAPGADRGPPRARHLADGELVLYDVSSSYLEGRSCPLAKLGYSRDGKRGTLQIVYGLLCDRPGRPICVEVFTGELHDDKTLPAQVAKLKGRFGLTTVIVVCDRGMVTKANLELIKESDGVDWITALKAPQVKRLVARGTLQLSLLDEQNLAEIEGPEDYPGERLVVCRNPLVAAERARKREELLAATERGLEEIQERVKRGTLQGQDQIGLAVGPALKRYRVKKHFEVEITDTSFHYARKTEQIPAEAALDGFYLLRTSVPAQALATGDVVHAYKGLEEVERAFGTFKGPELEIRPIHHRLEDRVRAHVLLCMLAYYLTWHEAAQPTRKARQPAGLPQLTGGNFGLVELAWRPVAGD